MRNRFIYTKENLSQISFPLGGIGSGCIGLSGNGQLIDWEIFNAPNKNSFNNYSGFFLKAEKTGKSRDIVVKALNGDFAPPYQGKPYRGGDYGSGFGFGPNERTFAGFSHFRECTFRGEFPLANLSFIDEDFPGQIKLYAFNPFIPLNSRDSSIPAAFFEIEIQNNSEETIVYTAALAVGSSFTYRDAKNESGNRTLEDGRKITFVRLGTDTINPTDTLYGDITIASDAPDCSTQSYWYRGGWRDNVEMFMRDFAGSSRLRERFYNKEDRGEKDMGTLAVHLNLKPGETQKVRFLISWNYPNCRNTWNENVPDTTWKNYYAVLFKNSLETAVYAFRQWKRLYEETKLFHDCLFSSDLEEELMDAVSANLSVLKSPVCLRLEDGTLYGFEGCKETVGSCEGSCTHVWNYAYVVPYLFPMLERSMLEADFTYNMREDGRMNFRLMLPLGSIPNDIGACVDGQMGNIIKIYRDWKICGDTEWLAGLWDKVKKAISFAWAQSNEDKWDPGKTGVITGRQHHTLDTELFGPSAWLNGFYLAALKAGAQMAEALGDKDTALEYYRIFKNGKAYTDQELFNGEYYIQKIDLNDRKLLEEFEDEAGYGNFLEKYWNRETSEIKYQIAGGCEIDQVVAQWHANLIGLGEIFDGNQRSKALRSLYENNFKCMREVENPWRIFSLNDEKGLVICTWPERTDRPTVPLTYNTETMTGFEYQAAVHMMQEGMYEEGRRIIKAVRDRYDGCKRNPWSELECGSNYARSMASYSILLACSGFEYDGVKGRIGFHPLKGVKNSSSFFFSCETGWGMAHFEKEGWSIRLCYGFLKIREISGYIEKVQKVCLRGEEYLFQRKEKCLQFANILTVERSECLELVY